MKKILLAVVSLLILVQPLQADELKDARKVVEKSVDSVVSLLQNKKLEEGIRRESVMGVIKGVFDFNLMAKLTLGRCNWERFTPQEREEFVTLFSKELENTYYGKTEFFSGEAIAYGEPTQVDGKIHVPTRVLLKDEKMEVTYKLYKTTEDSWRIYDASIQGVSIISSFRAQYNQFLSKNSVGDFLKELRDKTLAVNQPQPH